MVGVFEAEQGVLDQVSAAVSVFVVADGTFVVSSPGNDRNGSGVT